MRNLRIKKLLDGFKYFVIVEFERKGSEANAMRPVTLHFLMGMCGAHWPAAFSAKFNYKNVQLNLSLAH